MKRRTLLTVALLALTTACASTSGRSSTYDRDRLSREELEVRPQSNMYDTVVALRSNWLRSIRGGIGGRVNVTPLVYVDGRPLGNVEVLRSVSTQSVQSARYMSASEAQNRYGMSEARPVIDISTRGRTP
ncbi:MAG TPA: hypothetical protein VGE02_04215 [Gemmatimonadales bacterium]